MGRLIITGLLFGIKPPMGRRRSKAGSKVLWQSPTNLRGLKTSVTLSVYFEWFPGREEAGKMHLIEQKPHLEAKSPTRPVSNQQANTHDVPTVASCERGRKDILTAPLQTTAIHIETSNNEDRSSVWVVRRRAHCAGRQACCSLGSTPPEGTANLLLL